MDAGLLGFWLLVIGVGVIVIELAVVALWSVRLSRRAQALSGRLKLEQAQLQADVERLRQSLAETAVLWQPYRRWLRWMRHPLAVAILRSYARRRAAAR